MSERNVHRIVFCGGQSWERLPLAMDDDDGYGNEVKAHSTVAGLA